MALFGGRRARNSSKLPTTMVMEELPTPRDTFVLKRGTYDKPGDKVEPGRAGGVAVATRGRAPHRRALQSGSCILRTRSPHAWAVNHDWQTFFGAGLVRTVEDFGAQGEPPLIGASGLAATEFIRTGWT